MPCFKIAQKVAKYFWATFVTKFVAKTFHKVYEAKSFVGKENYHLNKTALAYFFSANIHSEHMLVFPKCNTTLSKPALVVLSLSLSKRFSLRVVFAEICREIILGKSSVCGSMTSLS